MTQRPSGAKTIAARQTAEQIVIRAHETAALDREHRVVVARELAMLAEQFTERHVEVGVVRHEGSSRAAAWIGGFHASASP